MLDARAQRRLLREQVHNMEAMQAELALVRAEVQAVVDAQNNAPVPVPVPGGRPQFRVDPPVFDGGLDVLIWWATLEPHTHRHTTRVCHCPHTSPCLR